MQAETYFIVILKEDGSFSTASEMPEEGIEANRPATNTDVYTVAKQLVTEIESQLLTDRIVGTLARLLTPPTEETVADKVADALKKREDESTDSAE